MLKSLNVNVGDNVKLNKEQIIRSGGHDWYTEIDYNTIYTIKEIIAPFKRIDGYLVVKINSELNTKNELINTFWLKSLTIKEQRKLKLDKINESRILESTQK